jgi:hypothetical protein
VSEDLWRRANAQLSINQKQSKRNSKHEYLLSGSRAAPLLKCLTCQDEGRDHAMRGRHGVRRGARNGQEWTYYTCAHKDKGHRSPHCVGGMKLETAVWDHLCGMLKDPSRVLANLKKLSDAASKEHGDIAQEIAALTQRAEENKAQQARLARLYRLGKRSDDVLDAESAELEREAADVEGRLSLLRVQLEQAHQNTLPIKEVEDACALLAEGLDDLPFAQKRWIIKTLVDVVYARKDGWRMEGRLPGLVDGAGYLSKVPHHVPGSSQ